MNLFLDDIRNPQDVTWVRLPNGGWRVARNYAGFCNAINDHWQRFRQLPDFVSFDHDLCDAGCDKSFGFVEKTGYDCAVWLIEFCIEKNIDFPSFAVHSMNPVGKENIEQRILAFKRFRNEI